jgi:hypothetical protein
MNKNGENEMKNTNWKRTTDSLPDFDKYVLVWSRHGYNHARYSPDRYKLHGWFDTFGNPIEEPRFWIELPKAPIDDL